MVSPRVSSIGGHAGEASYIILKLFSNCQQPAPWFVGVHVASLQKCDNFGLILLAHGINIVQIILLKIVQYNGYHDSSKINSFKFLCSS